MAEGDGPEGPSPSARRARTLLVGAALLVAACAGGRPTDEPSAPSDPGTDLTAARQRAVVIETEGCGSADAARGSGLALDDATVLTAAHVVASARSIEVSGPGGSRPGELVAYDPSRDLALIAPAPPLADVPPPPARGELTEGGPGLIVAGATSGDVAATVSDVLVIEIDDVRSANRSTRRGYQIAAATAPGDSGAGFYDDDGRLVGLLFAVSTTDEERSWVTASSEIDAFLADQATQGAFSCDPDRSAVTRTP